jgi:hypothetical protein
MHRGLLILDPPLVSIATVQPSQITLLQSLRTTT